MSDQCVSDQHAFDQWNPAGGGPHGAAACLCLIRPDPFSRGRRYGVVRRNHMFPNGLTADVGSGKSRALQILHGSYEITLTICQ